MGISYTDCLMCDGDGHCLRCEGTGCCPDCDCKNDEICKHCDDSCNCSRCDGTGHCISCSGSGTHDENELEELECNCK